MREDRKTAPIELHYCCGKEREEKRGERGGRGEDNGVNAGRQAAVVLGLITHALSLSGEGSRWKACIWSASNTLNLYERTLVVCVHECVWRVSVGVFKGLFSGCVFSYISHSPDGEQELFNNYLNSTKCSWDNSNYLSIIIKCCHFNTCNNKLRCFF